MERFLRSRPPTKKNKQNPPQNLRRRLKNVINVPFNGIRRSRLILREAF